MPEVTRDGCWSPMTSGPHEWAAVESSARDATLGASDPSKAHMRIHAYALVSALALGLASPAAAQIERRLDRSFKINSDAVVSVRLSGGSIETVTGGNGNVDVRLTQIIRGANSEREADDLLADYEVSATQQGNMV